MLADIILLALAEASPSMRVAELRALGQQVCGPRCHRRKPLNHQTESPEGSFRRSGAEIGPVNLKRLKAWRQKQEARFKFDPKRGVSATDKATVEQRLLMERTRLERLLTEGVAELAAFSKEIRARRHALEQEARTAAEALLAADAALRGTV